MINNTIRISVKDLIRYVYQRGDLNMSFSSPTRAVAGTRLHRKIQQSRGESYQSEVVVSYKLSELDLGLSLVIHGRIDGLFFEDVVPVIEEIKSTHARLADLRADEDGLHFAQAKIYAFIYAKQNDFQKAAILLTYGRTDTAETRSFRRDYDLAELADFFKSTADQYLEQTRELFFWQEVRDTSIQQLTFPFAEFRNGQEILIEETRQATQDGYNLFVQAPTGLGKTLASLYPSVKSLADHHCSKIFYLTARTTTREAAELALDLMRQNGLRLKSVTLTAKEKICFKLGTPCEAEHCTYLAGYFDRVSGAIQEAFHYDKFTRHHIAEFAAKHRLCPFEFSLDLSLLCDCIICDYNYLFDPKVQLARYFTLVKEPFVFLIDEAHNLVDRSREMYSASLTKKEILDLQRITKTEDTLDIYSALKQINTFLLNLKKSKQLPQESFSVADEIPTELIDLLEDFLGPAEAELAEKKSTPYREELKDVYYRLMFFLKIYRLSQESNAYAIVHEIAGSNVTIKLLCLDASEMISDACEKGYSSVFFSATLSPSDYFFRLLGGRHGKDYAFELPSPYPEDNLCLCLVDHISTRYRDRARSYDPIAHYLSVFIRQKAGNYFIFFPSFQYLEEVHARFETITTGIEILKQERSMTEADRDNFLAMFTADREKPLAAFVVTGGIFGESIDLPGEKLIGVAIIGVGLPQINQERDLIRYYFDAESENGFHYAYTFPGMNRVLQAAGRLIRTETDRGSLLLIDDRFNQALYRNLYPAHWGPVQTVKKPSHLEEIVHQFWSS